MMSPEKIILSDHDKDKSKSMMMWIGKRRQGSSDLEKAQSLVELAIGLTILLLLVSGIFDVGRAIFTQFALQDAAEEGLVFGIGYPDNCAGIEQRVMDNLQNDILPITPTVEVTINGDDCEGATLSYGLPMDVKASANFVISMPFLTGQTLTLTGTANGTILRPKPET